MDIATMIDRLTTSGIAYADAVAAEATHEIEHAELKVQLIDSLGGSDNPETGKPHSYASAERTATASPVYRDSQRKGVRLGHAKMLTGVQWEIAKATAGLATATRAP